MYKVADMKKVDFAIEEVEDAAEKDSEVCNVNL